jgi:superfamily I DNA/RNA helicase
VNWSEQQLAIFAWFSQPASQDPAVAANLVVRARAGTGKTSTIVEGIRHAPRGEKILLAAFNKRIAEELQERLDHPDAIAQTLHSVGYRIVRNFWNVSLERQRGERSRDLSLRAAGEDTPDTILRLISKLHSLAREVHPLVTNPADLVPLAWEYECVPDEEWKDYGWTVEAVAAAAFRAVELAKQRPATGIDYSDMLFLPVANNWVRPQYDLVVIDEAQDMNAAQIEIAKRIARRRICVVGDDRQAIYGFRGADSGSLDRLKEELNAIELGLTTTYRCGRSIVEMAKAIVPDYSAAEQAHDGNVTHLPEHRLLDSIKVGDAVLSRVNSPLIAYCLKALKRGIPARVEGRDIAAQLRELIRTLSTGKARHSVPAFLERLVRWEEREIARASKLSGSVEWIASKIDQIQDRASALRAVADGASSVRELEVRVEEIFSNIAEGRAVVFSSVHKAKGLEWDRVFVLSDTFREGRREERNIRYVAITRARNELVWVGGAAGSEEVKDGEVAA